jgi:hypothetical protein
MISTPPIRNGTNVADGWTRAWVVAQALWPIGTFERHSSQ